MLEADLGQLVAEESACLDGHPRQGLKATHSGMNKFDGPGNSNFILVKDAIRLLVDNASNTPLTRVDGSVCALLERIDNNEQLEILEWISSIPYRKHHNTVKEARTSDTCEWLLRHKRFCEWEDTSSPVILLLQGFRESSFPVVGFYTSLQDS
jgi:hypothetical protein